ncbi:hypothetical protein [Metabacillus sediminilitoris]|nr:hypothetical protein [Metabacillus sediminilitoris]
MIYHDSQDLTHRGLFRLLVGHSKEIDFEKMMKKFYHCMIMTAEPLIGPRKKKIERFVS